jgi:tRNA/rRNA methyltransferase
MSRIRIVLVRPRTGGNVGSVARAMKNMGLGDLVLVRPRARRSLVSRHMAVHAADILDRARTVSTLAEAVADCALVVGTTARRGPYRLGAVTPRELAPEIARRARRQRVALVFGPEDHGLANEDLKACHRLIRIPTSAEYTSLNLAQAVLVCAYEIFVAAAKPAPVKTKDPDLQLAKSERIAFAFERLEQALLRIGFLPAENPDHIMHSLRRLFGRTGLEEREVRILLGIARQVEWFGKQKL